VHAVDVRLELPREKAGAPGGPERRSEHGDDCCGQEGSGDAAGAGGGDFGSGGEPAEHRHKNHGETENVEDVDAKEVGPGSATVAEEEFLDAEEEAEGEDFGAAKGRLFQDGVAGNALFAEAFGGEGHGEAGEENKERSGECPAELRPMEERGVAEVGAEPGVVAVGLEHEEAGEAAHPVDVRETVHFEREIGYQKSEKSGKRITANRKKR